MEVSNMEYQEKLNALRLKANSIINHIREVRDYRVDYRGRLKDGTEIIVPKQCERPVRGELSQAFWDFHVEQIVYQAVGYYDLENESPVNRAFMEIPF